MIDGRLGRLVSPLFDRSLDRGGGMASLRSRLSGANGA
jgi:hypothetical protein